MDDTRTRSTIIDETLDGAGIIPFADENDALARAVPGTVGAEADRPGSEPALDPGERVSVVDRELGLEDLPAPEGRYACPCCGNGATRVVRVRIVHHAGWAAVCALCAASLLEKLPGTIVGGMVKPSRKRRIGTIRAPGRGGGRASGAATGLGVGRLGSGQTPHGFRGGAAGGLRQAG